MQIIKLFDQNGYSVHMKSNSIQYNSKKSQFEVHNSSVLHVQYIIFSGEINSRTCPHEIHFINSRTCSHAIQCNSKKSHFDVTCFRLPAPFVHNSSVLYIQCSTWKIIFNGFINSRTSPHSIQNHLIQLEKIKVWCEF